MTRHIPNKPYIMELAIYGKDGHIANVIKEMLLVQLDDILVP